MNWKQLLIEAKELMGQSGCAAFDRAVKLAAVYRDPEFTADCDRDRTVPSDRLSEFTNDLCLNFLELLALLEKYPERQQWATGKLRQMYDVMMRDAMQANRTKFRQSSPVSATRQTMPLAVGGLRRQASTDELQEAESLQDHGVSEVQRLRLRVAILERENEALKRQVNGLQAALRTQSRFGARAQDREPVLA